MPINDRTLVRPPAVRGTGAGTETETVGRLERQDVVVVIVTDIAEMMAGVAAAAAAAASGRGTQAGHRGEDPVLPPAVNERKGFLDLVFLFLGHLALVLSRGYLVVCAHGFLFCSLNSALAVVRFPCLVSQSMGGVEKCTAVLLRVKKSIKL
jgi:hypothetical protein